MVFFTFEFDQLDKKYKPGDVVRCKITVKIRDKFKARSLLIRFKGYAHTEWTKPGSKNRRKKYTGDEEYFKSYQYMFGDAISSTNHEVLDGTQVYNPFFVLPPRLPSSFEATGGHIKFDVKVKYDIAWGFDYEERAEFFVISPLDLNEIPLLREPVKAVEQKIFGCFCFESEPMQLINILPKGGFVPGDTIPVTIRVDNGSNVSLCSVRVKLMEKLTFTTNSPCTDTKTRETTIKEELIRTTVAPFQNKVYETTFYLEPSFDWKIIKGCGIINASYYIKSEAISYGCHSNPDNTTVITVGTIPFNELRPINDQTIPVFNPTAPDDVIMEQPLPSYNEVSRAPSPAGLQVTHPKAPLASTEKIFVDDMPPPSFEESQKSPILIAGQKNDTEIEADETVPSAPPETNPTAPPQ